MFSKGEKERNNREKCLTASDVLRFKGRDRDFFSLQQYTFPPSYIEIKQLILNSIFFWSRYRKETESVTERIDSLGTLPLSLAVSWVYLQETGTPKRFRFNFLGSSSPCNSFPSLFFCPSVSKQSFHLLLFSLLLHKNTFSFKVYPFPWCKKNEFLLNMLFCNRINFTKYIVIRWRRRLLCRNP